MLWDFGVYGFLLKKTNIYIYKTNKIIKSDRAIFVTMFFFLISLIIYIYIYKHTHIEFEFIVFAL